MAPHWKMLLRRPEIRMEDLLFIAPILATLPPEVRHQLEIGVKYEGYIRRQQEEIDRFRRTESQMIPARF